MKRSVLVCGWLALFLGALGVVLPLLPTTPFVLLAAACFARSSERAHNWLQGNSLFGPMLQRWECERCIELRTKCLSLTMMFAAAICSVGFMLHTTGLRAACALLILVGAVVVLRIRTCPVKASILPVSELS